MASKGERETPTTEHEVDRQLQLRCFYVYLSNGLVETVWAHMHESHGPAGHLNFITVSPEGIHQIRDSFNNNLWRRVHELVDETPIGERQVH